MYLYFFQQDEWERRYNCALIDVESVPLTKRQSHTVAACTTIFLCAIFYVS